MHRNHSQTYPDKPMQLSLRLDLRYTAKLSLTILAWLILTPTLIFAATLPKHKPVPGGIAVIKLPQSAKSASFKQRPVWIVKEGSERFAVVGIALDHPAGVAELQTENKNIQFEVHPHEYEESRIYLTNKEYVSPPAKTLERIKLERQEIQAQFQVFTDTQPEGQFSLPVTNGIKTSRFGLRRFFNDQPRKPHSGLDLAAPENTPVQAPSEGRVLVIGNYYFNGRTIFIDHGRGLITMYCHLHSVHVQSGQQVAQGDIIGTVGRTGRVTGPHLHWSVNLGGAMVEPELFLTAQTADQP